MLYLTTTGHEIRRIPIRWAAKCCGCATTVPFRLTILSWGKPVIWPEVYTLGHLPVRCGLAVNPATGEMWQNENGPNGGDEINILKPGRNYGWPVVSLRTHLSRPVAEFRLPAMSDSNRPS